MEETWKNGDGWPETEAKVQPRSNVTRAFRPPATHCSRRGRCDKKVMAARAKVLTPEIIFNRRRQRCKISTVGKNIPRGKRIVYVNPLHASREGGP